MLTSTNLAVSEQVTAAGARFDDGMLFVRLSDGRELGLPLGRFVWLQWLANATPQQRENWSIEPGGYAIYWEDLDDGIEVEHLLAMEPLT